MITASALGMRGLWHGRDLQNRRAPPWAAATPRAGRSAHRQRSGKVRQSETRSRARMLNLSSPSGWITASSPSSRWGGPATARKGLPWLEISVADTTTFLRAPTEHAEGAPTLDRSGRTPYKGRHREPAAARAAPPQRDPQVVSNREEPKMKLTRRELIKAAAALGAGAVPGALARHAHGQTTQKRELVVAQGGDISKFDPHFSTSSNDIRVSFNIFDNLVSRHPDGKLHAGLATEWKLQGQTTWDFKLRQGVK